MADELGINKVGERVAPKNGGGEMLHRGSARDGEGEAGDHRGCREEDAPGTMGRGVMRADDGRGKGDEFSDASGALLKGREEGAQVGNGRPGSRVKANAIVHGAREAVLEVAKKTS